MSRQGDRSAETVGTDELVAQLRRLRARSGLTLAALGERTNYSKSSWGRYLSGRSLPPYQAVLAFCRAVETDHERVLALWEAAHRERARWTVSRQHRQVVESGSDRGTDEGEVLVPEPVNQPSPSPPTTSRDHVPIGLVLGCMLCGLGVGCLFGVWASRARD
ncbi:Helix-turn-helix domain-containing protein [Actinopolyspora alba]|uniref:Helix-turn-helix domain-containing protein n=1 Tax=Actinopolyspora alba TaxID=673379 RepID=A0A1I1WFV6_9ACTN|nr:helix-turn-helix transcriptional regulator [Actinopolyspora alba]SFD94027.1 Helix-turn-helix domain-containing protein [Actinopolyspora alba]